MSKEDTTTDMTDVNIADERMESLKKEATDLGIAFSPRISEKALSDRISAYYDQLEKAAEAVTPVATLVTESSQEAREAFADLHMRTLAREMEAKARKTRIVTIIDNDQRINNATTTCTANCSNDYFDLGTIILPLNEKVEVRQGHLDALTSVRIPHHVRSAEDPSMSETVMRPRYTIQYEAPEQ